MTALSSLTPDTHAIITCDTQHDAADWDDYVSTHTDGTFFHRSGWSRAVKAAYGYDAHYITARKNGALTGVLVLTDAKTPLLGRSLVSSAFTVGGGPLADDPLTLAALLSAAETLGAKLQANYVECRSGFSAEGWAPVTGLHASFSAPLIAKDQDALAAIPRKRRAEIRKALDTAAQNGITVHHDGEPELFYALYAQSLHRLGTPVFSKRFLTALLQEFEEETEITVVEYQGKPAAALLSFYFNGAVLPYYVGASGQARTSRAFDYIYWAVMRRAVEKGCDRFDFGRSKIDSGAYQYKKLWGFEPQPLSYQVKLINADSLPNVNAKNPKFSIFAKIWPHLPAFAANRLGPLLAPNFP